MSNSDEVTPVQKQTTLELIFQELSQLRVICQGAADSSLATRELMRGLVARVELLERQRTTDRAAWFWAPLFIASVAFAGFLWLAFKFGHG